MTYISNISNYSINAWTIFDLCFYYLYSKKCWNGCYLWDTLYFSVIQMKESEYYDKWNYLYRTLRQKDVKAICQYANKTSGQKDKEPIRKNTLKQKKNKDKIAKE